MRAIAMHRRAFRASLGSRNQVKRCYSRWTSDDAAEPKDNLQSSRNSQQQSHSSRFNSDDMKVEDDVPVHAPAPHDSAKTHHLNSTNFHHEVKNQVYEYRHRKHSSHLRPSTEEVQHDKEGRQIFGPQDKPPINYFTLPKQVYSLQDETVNATEDTAAKAEKHIQDLRRKAWSTLEPVETEDGRLLFTRPRTADVDNTGIEIDELFEISPLLMDLDSWENPNVRVFNASDEKAQSEKWSKKPRWLGVVDFVDRLEERVSKSHTSFETLLAERYSPSRVTAWDVVSVALRGVNPDSTPSESPKSIIGETSRRLDPREGNSVSKMIEQNGIPEQSQRRDTLLIDWMLMRKARLALQAEARQPVSRRLDPDELLSDHKRLLAKEKAKQTPSLPKLEPEFGTALRRSVVEMLRSGLSLSSTIEYTRHLATKKCTSTLLEGIQDLGRALSTSRGFGRPRSAQLLAFVASLLNTVPEGDTGSQLQLSWLATRLALDYDARTALHYLEQALGLLSASDNGGSVAPAWEDVKFVVQTMNAKMSNNQETSWDVTESGLASCLVRLYTGFNDDGYLDLQSPSLRTLIVQNISLPPDNEMYDTNFNKRWLQTYDDYLEGLGYIGAAQVIWAEWTSLNQLRGTDNHQSEDEQQLLASFCKATRVLLNYHSGSSDIDESTIRSAISGSLENWLNLLKKHGWKQVISPTQHSAPREDMPAVSGA